MILLNLDHNEIKIYNKKLNVDLKVFIATKELSSFIK